MAIQAVKRWTPCRNWATLQAVLTVEEVCSLLRMSKPTVLKLLAAGEIPAAKIGAKWCISKDALKDYIEGNGKEQTA